MRSILEYGGMRVRRISSRTRELVAQLMRAADNEDHKIRPEMRKILKTRHPPDEDDDDPVDAA
jgi:hypothetical protein